jgi:hypothetical protein
MNIMSSSADQITSVQTIGSPSTNHLTLLILSLFLMPFSGVGISFLLVDPLDIW